MAEKTIAELSQSLIDSLRRGREAIIGRGGEIGTTAGFADFPSAIYNIPADNAITTDVHNDEAQSVAVPEGTYDYAYLAEFGGITYRDTKNNSLYSVGLIGLQVTREINGDIISTVNVPQEIIDLEGYGDGISIDYYDKVNLVNKKYLRCIETYEFDGSEDEPWEERGALANLSGYAAYKIGALGTYANHTLICDKIDRVNISSNNNNIGIDMIASSGYKGDFVAIRPEGVKDSIDTLDKFIAWLQKNPIIVKVARLVPIEHDLPVDMNPLFKVESNTFVDLYPEEGKNMPVKIIFQTRTQ